MYIKGENIIKLLKIIQLIKKMIRETRRKIETKINIIIAEDFNRHN